MPLAMVCLVYRLAHMQPAETRLYSTSHQNLTRTDLTRMRRVRCPSTAASLSLSVREAVLDRLLLRYAVYVYAHTSLLAYGRIPQTSIFNISCQLTAAIIKSCRCSRCDDRKTTKYPDFLEIAALQCETAIRVCDCFIAYYGCQQIQSSHLNSHPQKNISQAPDVQNKTKNRLQ